MKETNKSLIIILIKPGDTFTVDGHIYESAADKEISFPCYHIGIIDKKEEKGNTPNCEKCGFASNMQTSMFTSAFVCKAQGYKLLLEVYGNDFCKELYKENN